MRKRTTKRGGPMDTDPHGVSPQEAELVRLATELAQARAELVLVQGDLEAAQQAVIAAVDRALHAELEHAETRAQRDRLEKAHAVLERDALPRLSGEPLIDGGPEPTPIHDGLASQARFAGLDEVWVTVTR